MSEFLGSVINWCFFRIHLIHNSSSTEAASFFINLGVDWSLSYEWLFYFSLPLISILILKIKPKIGFIILSVIFIVIFYEIHDVVVYHIYSFIGGAVAAFLLKFTSLYKKIKDIYSSIIILICLFLIVQFNTAYNIYCQLLISIVFTFLALGASFLGLLKNSTLKFLGEISYSTYLLHAILLFTVFRFGFGLDRMYYMTPLQYCFIIFSITPILVLVSFLGFKFIEKPSIDKAKTIVRKLDAKSVR